jgi:AcrR family transcriptional regulator
MPERVSAAEVERESAKSRIIAAAFSVLAVRGSHQTSVKEVARAAGVAPGLVHYYFSSKAELLLEVVREACRAYHADMDQLELPTDAVQRTQSLLAWSKKKGLERPDWYRLLVELDSLAVRDDALAREVSVLKREVRDHTADLVRAVEPRLSSAADAMAAVIIYAVDGLVVQHLIDPTFDLDAGFAALESMLLATLTAARSADSGN